MIRHTKVIFSQSVGRLKKNKPRDREGNSALRAEWKVMLLFVNGKLSVLGITGKQNIINPVVTKEI